MQFIKLCGVISLGMGLGSIAFASNIVYPSFEYKDWQIVCDNTRECRAAGYSLEDAKNRVSVLLSRKAGVGQEVSARVKFSDISDDDGNVNEHDTIILKIDDKSYGKIGSLSTKEEENEKGSHSLNKIQIQALLQALKGTSKIAFVGDNKEWVLPAMPKPIIYSKSIPKGNPKLWQSKIDWDVLKKELPSSKQFSDDNYCEILTEGDNEYHKFDPKVVEVLTNDHLLVSGLCWRAAYNEGYGYWMINQQQPYQPKLITTMADGVVEGDFTNHNQLSSSMKGRGLGDCWSHVIWTWNGNNFVKTYDGTSGLCRMIILGGVWDLPNYIATVI